MQLLGQVETDLAILTPPLAEVVWDRPGTPLNANLAWRLGYRAALERVRDQIQQALEQARLAE